MKGSGNERRQSGNWTGVMWPALGGTIAFPMLLKCDHTPFHGERFFYLRAGYACARDALLIGDGECNCEVKDSQGKCKNPYTQMIMEKVSIMVQREGYYEMYNIFHEIWQEIAEIWHGPRKTGN